MTYQEKQRASYEKLQSELTDVLGFNFTLTYDEDREIHLLTTTYKGIKFEFYRHHDGYLRASSGYHRLPKVGLRDSKSFDQPAPNGVKKLRKNAIIRLLDYEVEKYNYLKTVSDSYLAKVEESEKWLKENGFEKLSRSNYQIYTPNSGKFYNPLNVISSHLSDDGRLVVNIEARNFSIDSDKDKTLAFWKDVQNLMKKYQS